MNKATKAEINGYEVMFEPLPRGGFDVVVHDAPEICTFGRVREEATSMADDAIRCHRESRVKERRQRSSTSRAH